MSHFFDSTSKSPPRDVIFPAVKQRDSLTEIFCGIEGTEFTGELSISTAKKSVFFSFHKGEVVHVEECTLGDTVAQFFLQEGLLSTKQYSEAVRLATDQFVFNEDMLFCNIAVQLGFLTKQQVQAAYRQRIRAKVIEAVGWFDYRFAFNESSENLDGTEFARTQLAPLIYTGIRAFYTEVQLTEYLRESLTEVVILRAPIDEIEACFELDSNEKDFVELCDKQLSVAAIIESSKLVRLHALQLMYMLKISKKVAFADVTEVTGRASVQRVSEPDRSSDRRNAVKASRRKEEIPVSEERHSAQISRTTQRSFYPECVIVSPASRNALEKEEQTIIRKRNYGTPGEAHSDQPDLTEPAIAENKKRQQQSSSTSITDNSNSKPVALLRSVRLLQKTLSKSRGQQKCVTEKLNGQQEAEGLWRAGKRYLDEQCFTKARDNFQRATELAPEQPAYQMYYFWAAKNVADETGGGEISLSKVKRVAESQTRVEEHRGFAYYILGRLALLEHKERVALKCFTRSIRSDPSIRDAQRYHRILSRRCR